LKHIEAELLKDLKKGGFARTLNNASSDDDLPEEDKVDYKSMQK